MIRIKRHIKRMCLKILLIIFLLIIFKSLVTSLHSDIDSNTLRDHLKHLSENEAENHDMSSTKIYTSDLKASELMRKVHHSEITVTRNPEITPFVSKCGYDSCPIGKPGFLNVHMVPHSHMDLGFLNTYDQYYNGEEGIVGAVKVIDAIIEGLKDHPYRKFMLAEMAFFQRWWNAQNETVKNIVKDLVDNGQLEFINGGWSMNDEAVTHYVDIIDQMSLGLNFLNETFGDCGRPKVGWQIDTFGHSKEHASILAQMGFDGMFLWRLHEKELIDRKKSKSLNFIWTGNQHLGEEGELFTSALFESFEPPEYLCLKKGYFNEKWVNLFLDDVKFRAKSYITSDIIVPVGSDFRMRQDFTCFVPTDKLIEHTNKLQEKGSKVNLFYSTPSCYLKALNSYRNITWPSKTDDMFPYATQIRGTGWFQDINHDQDYWTGFYTSRPAFKYMVREGSNFLQSCRQMASYLSLRSEKLVGDISVMKEAMGVMQHHDAITGTSKQFVMDDYIRILYRGLQECRKIQNSFYLKTLPKITLSSTKFLEVSYCNLNMSSCDVTEKSQRVIVNVYNSLSSFLDKYVRIPILNQIYRLFDPSGKSMPFDVIPIPEFIKNLPGRNSSATHELVFLANHLPPLGSKSYYIEVANEFGTMELKAEMNGRFIENQRVRVQLNRKTGLIESISVDDYKLELEQEFLWYAAKTPFDGNIFTGLNSAMYKLRTLTPHARPIRMQNNKIAVSIFKGELVQEIHQHYNSYVSQVIRLYKGQDHVELDWVVGPIDLEDNVGKEVVNRVTTKLSSKQMFYTDANGRQILKRRIGAHGNLNVTNFLINDTVAGNYYPINAHISIKDEGLDKQLTMLVDRAQGGSSLNDGQLELMVHRRHEYNREDGKEMSQDVLSETAYGVGLTVRGTHLLVLSSITESAKLTRFLAHQMYKQPLISFIPTSLSLQEWTTNYNMETRMLNEELPSNVNLLTFEKRSDTGEYLLRLEHLYDVDEDCELYRPVIIDLRKLFKEFSIITAEETMLGGNQFKKNAKRLVWKKLDKILRENDLEGNITTVVDIKNVRLRPMQIRSFVVTIQKK